jgi:hypothetical protein
MSGMLSHKENRKMWARIEPTSDCKRATSFLLDIANGLPEMGEGVREILQLAPEFFRVKNDILFAVGTNYLVVSIEPTERLMELMAAHRARENERTEG